EGAYGGLAGATAADIDADGYPDLVVTRTFDRVDIFRGSSTGLVLRTHLDAPAGGSAVGDFNGDGLPDIVVAKRENGLVFLNASGFQFRSELPVIGAALSSLTAVDLDGNG